MISHDSVRHNAAGIFIPELRLILGLLLAAAALVQAGCGRDQKDQSSAQEQARNPTETDCPALLDTSAWEAFLALGDRLSAGEQVPATELEGLGDLPAITLWRESMAGNVPASHKVGNWVESAFWDSAGRGRPEKPDPDRVAFGKAMRFNYDQRQEINLLLGKYRDEQHPCRVFDLASRWLEPGKIPDPLPIYFVASKPELRSHYGQLIADTSLLLASGPDQLDRQMVALLYRDRQALPGGGPLELEGAESVANTLRTMMNEGVAAWIEDMPNTYFNPVHPRLGKVFFVPENVFSTGIRAQAIFNSNLPAMLSDEAVMQERGQSLSRAITGAGAFTQGGYCMAAVIAHRLGEDRLHAVRLSPSAFLAAFQEAALMNTLPLPLPGEMGRELYETIPAFNEEVYPGLLKLLEEHFPST